MTADRRVAVVVAGKAYDSADLGHHEVEFIDVDPLLVVAARRAGFSVKAARHLSPVGRAAGRALRRRAH